MRLMSLLGISEEDVLAREQKRAQHQADVKARWSAFCEQPHFHEKKVREKIAMSVFSALNTQAGPCKVIRPNAASLNKLINWSSSRYNAYCKADVVEAILNRVHSRQPEHYQSEVWQSGAFSAGAHGHGGRGYGGRNFAITGQRGGHYQLFLVDSYPYLIINSNTVVLFEGVDYPPLVVDEQFLHLLALYHEDLERFA